MAHHDHIIELEPSDVIAVRDRPHRPGCALELSTRHITYLSPEQEALLFQILFERQFPRDAISHRFGDGLNVVGIIDSTTSAVRLHEEAFTTPSGGKGVRTSLHMLSGGLDGASRT